MKQYGFLILFITVLWLLTPCHNAHAQQRLIAVVMVNSQPRYEEVHSAFIQKSKEFCDNSCEFYVQTPNADFMSLRNSVRKAVALGADLIVTYGPLATLAARAEVPPMPTLFADVYDPVGLGIVSEKSLTGLRMTGVRGDAPIQGLLKYFNDTVNVRKMAVLYDEHSPEAKLQKDVFEESSKRKGIEIITLAVGEDDNHVKPMNNMPSNLDGLFLASSEHHESQLEFVLEKASQLKVPVITQRARAAELGAFMVLESSALEQGTKLAEMAGKVFAGTDIEDLPMHRPHDVAFVINLKAAREYGIDIPIQTLSVASRVIR